MKLVRRFGGTLLSGCLLYSLVFASVSQAAGPSVSLPNPEIPESPSGPVVFAQIQTSMPGIVLNVESVKVTVRHAATADSISVASNCPAHWNVNGNTVRQVALSSTQKGVSLHASGAGAEVTVNGHIYQLPQGSDGAIHSLKVENGQVIINGQKLDPLPGSNVPGDCTGPDALEVTVPQSYEGGLELICTGTSSAQLDSWQKGPLVVSLAGQSSLTTGPLKKLEKAVIDVQGSGSAQIADLTAHALVANITGSGTLTVSNGSADMSNATISGTGSMHLKGSYKNLKKSVNGTGTIQIEN